jgi:hypothetical protein
MGTKMVTEFGSIRLTVTRAQEGWTICEERNEQVIRKTTVTDWHRVERAREAFERRHGREAVGA